MQTMKHLLRRHKIFVFSMLAIAAFTPLCWGQEAISTADITVSSTLDIRKVFQGAPIIYTILLVLSVSSFVLWLYSLLTLRENDMMPVDFMDQVREHLDSGHYEAALVTCQEDNNFSASIIATGINNRTHGSQVIMESMQAEGRRSSSTLWQRISILNDIAVIAPMFGLLGTVLGMFYAFYDTNRTQESIATIFDGLGMAIGTTVAGLIVAIVAMIFYTSLKLRVVKLLNKVENETLTVGSLIALKNATSQKEKNAL